MHFCFPSIGKLQSGVCWRTQTNEHSHNKTGINYSAIPTDLNRALMCNIDTFAVTADYEVTTIPVTFVGTAHFEEVETSNLPSVMEIRV